MSDSRARSVPVNARAGKYFVTIGEGLDIGSLAVGVKKPCRAVIVSDNTVYPLYGAAVADSLAREGFDASAYLVDAGEGAKRMEVLERLLRFFVDREMTRGDLVLALGGGVVGDLGGFAAAVYMRGVDFIQIPTTILAAVDSSVGGKTGVNLPEGKNLVGAFHQPIAVFCDTRFFETLPEETRANGMAEAVKHGMIADRELLLGIGGLPIAEVCRRNVEIKAGIVERDELDRGVRNLLNFGHTIGHAVEKLSDYRTPHGSAVAIGMSVIARASERSGLTESPCAGELAKALRRLGLPTTCGYPAEKLAEAALRDKKRSGEAITLVIPKEIGRAELCEMPVSRLGEFIAKGLGE